MIGLLLQISNFEHRVTEVEGQEISFNFIFKEYNGYLQELSINSPRNSDPSYIYEHASSKIQDLSVRGSFGESMETGLIWNNMKTKIYNVLLEIDTKSNSKFSIVGRGVSVLVLSSFFEVDSSIVKMDTAKVESLTSVTLYAKYILCNGAPYKTFIRGDAVFTMEGMLPSSPIEYNEPCRYCISGSSGQSCSDCLSGTYLDKESCAKDPVNCKCICDYSNEEFNEFYDTCSGEPITSTEPVLAADGKTKYYFECQNHKAIYINHTTSGQSFVIELFKDDSCGLNNLELDLEYKLTINVAYSAAIRGITETMTENISDLNVTIRLYNSPEKMDESSPFFIATQQEKTLAINNIYYTGSFEERGTNKNDTEAWRVPGMFHYVNNTRLSLYNISIEGLVLSTYWSSTYGSLFISRAVNSVIKVSYVYIGDNETSQSNPMMGIDVDTLDSPHVNCTDKMDITVSIAASLFESLPREEYSGRRCSIAFDDGPNIAGFVSYAANTEINMYLSLVSLYSGSSYSKSLGSGIISSTFINSKLATKYCVFNGYMKNKGASGLLGTVNGSENIIYINAAVNLSTSNSYSGVIGYFEAGQATFNVYLNVSFSATITGGLIGVLKAGIVTISGAFGSVIVYASSSNKEVGSWLGGQIDDQICDESQCTLQTPKYSFINASNTEDGVCAGKVESMEPVGYSSDMYFLPCQRDTKVKITYDGEIPRANLSIFESGMSCELINIKISGSIAIQSIGTINISGMVKQNYKNASELIQEIEITDEVGCTQYAALVSINGTDTSNAIYTFDHIVIRGKFTTTANPSISLLYVSAFLIEARKTTTITNIMFLGTELELYSAQRASFLLCINNGPTKVSNVLIDNFKKSNAFPDYENVAAESDFPCGNLIDEDFTRSTYYKRLLVPSNKPSFIKAVKQTVTNSGALLAYSYADVSFQNVAANISEYIEYSDGKSNAALLGVLFSGKISVSLTYITGKSMVQSSGIIAYSWTHCDLNITVEYTFDKPESAPVLKFSTSEYYKEFVALLLNLKLVASETAGVSYENDSGLKRELVAGTILKSCTDCYNNNYFFSRNTASVSDSALFELSVSNSLGTCPAPLDTTE